jgi:CII-binding regulator of phage lambda lysogenization HflD
LYVNGAIQATGDVTAYYSSDIRLKSKVENIENALDKLFAINGVTYNWNEIARDKDTTIREAGVIAQEVMSVLPEVVVVRENGYLAVRYDKLTALLIEGVKELATELRDLKKKLGA